MDGELRQSTAHTFQMGPFLDDADGKTAETALTIPYTDVYLSKHGGAAAAKNDTTNLTGTGDARGYYDCVMNATDIGTLGTLKVMAHIAGALPVWHTFEVITQAEWDRKYSTGATVAEVKTVVDAILVDTGTTLDAALAVVDGNVDSILADTGTDGVVIPQAQADKVWGTAARALTDKADFALSAASRAAIWDEVGAISSLSFELLVERLYEMINNKMIVTEATGAVALRNLADSADVATGNVQDLGATTQRNALTWV